MAANFDMNKFNTMVSQASEAILCNSECRKKKAEEKLKHKFLNAQTNLDSASDQVQVAEKNYVTFTQGSSAYNELLDSQLEQKAEQIANVFIQNFEEEVLKTTSQIDMYDGLLINYKNVFELFKKYARENIELTKELKDETNDVLTNERKTYYEDQNIDSLKIYYFYFLLVVYIICVLCFGFFSLTYPSQTSWKTRLFIFIVLIILPFFSTVLLGKIIYFIYEAYNLLPKNIYGN